MTSICRYNMLELSVNASVLCAAGYGTVIAHEPIFQDIYEFIESRNTHVGVHMLL